jgi:hypothetical protein
MRLDPHEHSFEDTIEFALQCSTEDLCIRAQQGCWPVIFSCGIFVYLWNETTGSGGLVSLTFGKSSQVLVFFTCLVDASSGWIRSWNFLS